MAVDAHLRELKTKHQTLETEIQSLMKTPAPDHLHLLDLKKRKLYLKEQIHSLQ